MSTIQNLSRTKFLPFIVVGTVLLAMVALLSVPISAENNRSNPYEVLAQHEGRLLPNERPPRDDIVAAQAAGIPLNASAAEARAIVDEWYKDFYSKKQKSGPNPIAYAERMADLTEAEANGKSVKAMGGGEVGTAKMLMIPFEFAGTDVITACEPISNTVVGTVEVAGPMHGTITDPSLDGDNNTIWTDNFDIQWYEELMFGNGVGVVRTDLNDGAGVDMTGVSATNWYLEQSEGAYTLTGDIYPEWIQLDHSVAYYGWDGNETNADGNVPCDGTSSGFGFEFTIDIVNKLNETNPDFDWAQYDVDGNGIVDHLMVIHAGVDNSAGGGDYGNYQLWAHSWDVFCDLDGDGNLDYGCVADDGGTPDDPSDDILVGNYTHIPEDADIGVVVHEYGHDIGLPDYYDQTGETSNSTAHWIVMSGGSWSGALGGSHPAPFNPWARYFFGWEEPTRLDYTTAKVVHAIGQSDPTPTDTLDSVWIDLPDQEVTVDNLAGEGKGLHSILGNNVFSTLSREFDLTDAVAPSLTFSTSFDIEEDWDYAYVRASVDGGENWDVLLNEEAVYATEDPNGTTSWLGEGGLTGVYRGMLTYNLSAYAGEASVWIQFAYATDGAVQNPGIWLDDIVLDDYSNDLEDSSDWTNDGGWEEVPYNNSFSHYYMLEWRNDTGSIASQGHTQQYYSLAHDETGWNADKFPANVPGLLIWYRNNFYSNNQAVNGGREFASPATGPKGELLLVDSHFEPVVWSDGWWDAENGVPQPEFSNRRSAMDGAFNLEQTPSWMIHDYAVLTDTMIEVGNRPAVSVFDDSKRWVPGWIFPGDGTVYRADQDASVVIPANGDYTTRIRGLDETGTMPGEDLTDLWGLGVGGQAVGTGHPGSSGTQYGVNVEVVSQADDGSRGVIAIWNSVNPTVTAVEVSALSSSGNSLANSSLPLAMGALLVLGLAGFAIRRRK